RAVLATAVEYVAGPVVIDVLGLEIASVVLVEVPAAHAVVPLGTLRPVVALRTAITGIALGALPALDAIRALRSHVAVVAAIALRASGAVRALAVEHVARAVPIHVLGLEVAVTVLIQVPAIHSVHALRAGVAFRPLRTGYSGVTGYSWVAFHSQRAGYARVALHSQRTGYARVAFHSQRTGYARVAFRARRPARALWPGRPDGTDRSRGTVRARCAHPRRRRHGHLSLDAGREPEMDLRVFQLAAVVHERAGRLGLRGGAPADAGHRE